MSKITLQFDVEVEEVIEKLITEKEIKFSVQDVLKSKVTNTNMSFFIWACVNTSVEFVEKLLDTEVDIKEDGHMGLVHAIAYDKFDVAKLLIERGVDFSPHEDFYSLEVAVTSRTLEIAKLLLEKGADPNVNDTASLFLAVEDKNVEMAALLIEYGANITARNNTIIEHAARNNDMPMVRLLLEKERSLSKNRRSLYWAIRNEAIEMIEFLFKYGACCDLKLMKLAKEIGNDKIIKLLEEKIVRVCN